MDPATASHDEDGRAPAARLHSEEDTERIMSSFEEGSSEGSAASASRDPVLPCKQMAWHSLFPAYSDAARVGQPRAYDPIMDRCELACAD